MQRVYHIRAQMPSGQYGNDKMLKLATDLAEHPTLRHKRPLLVNVQEHGGWFLQFFYGTFQGNVLQGEIVGTANDGARFSSFVDGIRAELETAEIVDESTPKLEAEDPERWDGLS